jgi:hypothetical protein
MSHGSKIGISLLIGLCRPLVEGRERIVERPPIALRQDDPATLDTIDKLVSRFQTECRSHGAGIVVCALLVSLLLIIAPPGLHRSKDFPYRVNPLMRS